MLNYFITGTDTGVGKTLISSALLHAFALRGLRVVGMKPVASGATQTEDGLRNEDVEQLLAASNVKAARELVNPYCFEPPVAPHLAAANAGIAIDLEVIARAYAELVAQADVVIVEGVGGFRVPLSSQYDTADLAVQLSLPVILVVGLRLGCINHALLTVEAIRARGLKLAGWVANHLEPNMPFAALNVETLRARSDAPLIGEIPYFENALQMPAFEYAAKQLDISALSIL